MTPHNDAKKEDIAKIVIMPGDPLRAKLIADNYLTDVKEVSHVRGMVVYTGKYKGKEITVMPSGMGIPSMGIYSYELFNFYDVEKIIKVGTCGSYTKDLDLGDLVIINASYSESTYAKVQDNVDDHLIYASDYINFYLKETAEEQNKHVTIANVHSTDVFYGNDEVRKNAVEKEGCLVCEMESFSLFHNAKKFKRHAAQILTVSDSLVTKSEMTSEERQNKVTSMIEVALETALKL